VLLQRLTFSFERKLLFILYTFNEDSPAKFPVS